MIITYYGGEFFKIQWGDITVALNPLSINSKLASKKITKFGADIALVSLNDNDFNGIENLTYGEKKPFIIDSSGEYEVKNIFVKGLPTQSKFEASGIGAKETIYKINNIYTLLIDGMKVCFLGAQGAKELDDKTKEEIDGVDILFIPIGGDLVLSPPEAYKIYVDLGPKIIIPMYFNDKNLQEFLNESGAEEIKPVEKLTIKKKDLEGKDGEVVILKSNI